MCDYSIYTCVNKSFFSGEFYMYHQRVDSACYFHVEFYYKRRYLYLKIRLI